MHKKSFAVSIDMGKMSRAYSQRKTNETYPIKSEMTYYTTFKKKSLKLAMSLYSEYRLSVVLFLQVYINFSNSNHSLLTAS